MLIIGSGDGWRKSPLPAKLPLAIALIEVNLTGKHRGDLDNLAGSCLDALVSAGVLADDNVNCVPSLIVTARWGCRLQSSRRNRV